MNIALHVNFFKFITVLCVCVRACVLTGQIVFCRTDCLFSPSDQLVVTGVSVKKGEGSGQLLFFDRNTLQRVSCIDASENSVRTHFLLHSTF